MGVGVLQPGYKPGFGVTKLVRDRVIAQPIGTLGSQKNTSEQEGSQDDVQYPPTASHLVPAQDRAPRDTLGHGVMYTMPP